MAKRSGAKGKPREGSLLETEGTICSRYRRICWKTADLLERVLFLGYVAGTLPEANQGVDLIPNRGPPAEHATGPARTRRRWRRPSRGTWRRASSGDPRPWGRKVGRVGFTPPPSMGENPWVKAAFFLPPRHVKQKNLGRAFLAF